MPWWGSGELALIWANAIGDRAPSGNVQAKLGAFVAWGKYTHVELYTYDSTTAAIAAQSAPLANWWTWLRAKLGEGRPARTRGQRARRPKLSVSSIGPPAPRRAHYTLGTPA